MPTHSLEKNIQEWRSSLSKHQQLEPGTIEELEGHLRDSIEAQIEQGIDPLIAFNTAIKGIEEGFTEVMDEFHFTSPSKEPKPKWRSSWWIPALLPNILKVLLRNFKRQPGYSFINISGLAIGMACCFIIYLYVANETSYDTFHEHSDRTFRVDQTNIWNNFDGQLSSTGPGVAGVLKSELPEIKTTVRVNNPPGMLISIHRSPGDIRYFEESRVLSADSTFFDIFTVEFVEGNPDKALVNPYSIVITEEIRERYFGDETAFGKSINIGNPGQEVSYEVTGVVKKMPKNSHFRFDLLSSLSSNPNVKRREDTWIWTVFVTYVLLHENASIEEVNAKLPSVLQNHAQAKIYSPFGMDSNDIYESNKPWEMYFTPITDIHLKSSEAGNRIGTVSDIFYVYVFSTVALLIILLACINFMNLSSARSVQRAKEVGVRKTLGSQHGNLIAQFLSESVLFAFISLIIALVIVSVSIGPFNQIAAKQLLFSDLFTPIRVLGIVGFTVVIGILSGIYPAFYLSSFNPIDAFKNKLPAISNSRLSFVQLRSLLVVVQFAISIILISSSIIIYQQLHFFQNANLGFQKENVLIIHNLEQLGESSEAFEQMVANQSGVVQVGKSSAVPPYMWHEDFGGVYGSSEAEISVNSVKVDDHFLSTMGFELIKGKLFEENTAANARYAILNEAAVDQLNWGERTSDAPDFPLGESILFSGNEFQYEIIGVIRNFNSSSLHNSIQPMAIFHESSSVWGSGNSFLSARLGSMDNAEALLENIQENWNRVSGGLPFNYTFLDDQLYAEYQSEQQIAQVVSIFTFLAIFIAILGMIGLISFTIEKKTKEIGVRKVMGASVKSIVIMLSKEITLLIGFAIILSLPVTWYLMNDWLQNFEYQIDVNPLIIILSGVLSVLLAWIALSFQTVKAALQNPIKSLRSE